MAAPVIQSKSTYSWASNTSPVITKPTGLAVGDLMLAFIASGNNGGVNVAAPTTPTNWTQFSDATDPIGGGNEQHRVYGFWKIADSSDVAASNFTFVCDTTGAINAGVLFRITGHYATTPVTESDYAGDTNTTANPTVTVSTNTYSSEALMFMAWVNQDTALASTDTASNYVVTGITNPSWTEEVELFSNVGTDAGFVVASAVSGQLGTITAIEMDVTSSATNWAGSLSILAPQTNASGTTALLSADADFFAPTSLAEAFGTTALHTADADIFSQSGRANTGTAWSNESETDTTWTNEAKVSTTWTNEAETSTTWTNET